MENNVAVAKKSNKGLVFFIIVLILIIVGMGLYILNEKGVIKLFKTNNNTKETKEVEKKETNNDSTVTNDTEDSNYIINVDSLKLENGDNELGELTVGGKKYTVKTVSEDNRLNVMFNDTKLNSVIHIDYLHYIAVMNGKYVIVGTSSTGNGGIVDLYDSTLTKVESHGNTTGFSKELKTENINVQGTYNQVSQVLDNKTVLFYQCEEGSDYSNQVFTEKMIKFSGDKFEIKDIMKVENVYCMTPKH